MSDSIQLRDAANKVVCHADLSIYDADQLQLSFYDASGDDMAWFNLSAASARKLAIALLEAAEYLEGAK